MSRKHNRTGRARSGPPFVQLHKWMLDSPAWQGLSVYARAAYVEIAKLYNGTNNGTLGMGVRFLAGRLRCGVGTANRALAELDDVGFIDTVKFGGFSRRNRKASEYRLTAYRCDLSGHAASKKFMEYAPPLSQRRYNTVSVAGQLKENCRPLSQRRYRQGQKPPSHCPTGDTHIDINHGGTGERNPPVQHSQTSASEAQPPSAASERAESIPMSSELASIIQKRWAPVTDDGLDIPAYLDRRGELRTTGASS